MGKKDRKENVYFGNPFRFADLFNGYFKELSVDPKELEDVDTVLVKSDRAADIQRIADCLKKQQNDGSLLALYLLENQTYVDYGMVARVMLEEGILYDRQLREIKRRNHDIWKEESSENSHPLSDGEYLYGIKKEDRLKPVLPLIVYWGEKRWDGASTLHELLDFGEAQAKSEDERRRIQKLKAYVPDFCIHVLDVNTWEDFSMFQTEIRQVFELYSRRNDKKAFEEYVRSGQCADMDPETQDLICTLTGNDQFLKTISTKESEEKKMWKAIEDLIEDGRQEGFEKCIEFNLSALMQTMHWSIDQAMDALLIPDEKREEYRMKLK